MDLFTVQDVVAALVGTYAAGLEYYSNWQQRRWRQDSYQKPDGYNVQSMGCCALSTSLKTSGYKISLAYDGGAEILGEGFAVGDEECRDTLRYQLDRLQDSIVSLQRAIRAGDQPLGLANLIRVSETVRTDSLTALAKLYHQVAVGRLVPRDLPGSQRRSRLTISIPEEIRELPNDDDDDDDETVEEASADDRTTIAGLDGESRATTTTTSANKSPFHSEPPSPPLTPNTIPDDVQSNYTTSTTSGGGGGGPRPTNSVFSVFCPEAMKYQVNLRKPLPPPPPPSSSISSSSNSGQQTRCRCGYDWNGLPLLLRTEDGQGKAPMLLLLKDGFQITARFLGKSHCEAGGFGCVLCTSSGRTETYEGLADLRHHINTAHTKWQFLHDRDLSGR
ncbi:hypothetical protein F4778DRAFT_328103 [Xylariomycetidae sp. FL2044]|nr:hypothetical protein F4778DRAFT_328103 [Xylariomycetidae sp. FL2044]